MVVVVVKIVVAVVVVDKNSSNSDCNSISNSNSSNIWNERWRVMVEWRRKKKNAIVEKEMNNGMAEKGSNGGREGQEGGDIMVEKEER